MEEIPKLITIQKAAAMLGVTPLTLRNWDKAGKLKPLRHPMNNYRVYRREDIEKIVSGMTTESVTTVSVPKAKTKSGPKKIEVQHLEDEERLEIT